MNNRAFVIIFFALFFQFSCVAARYHGKRKVVDQSEKTVFFDNQTGFDCLVVAKTPHCTDGVKCDECVVEKLKKKVPTKTSNKKKSSVALAHRILKGTGQSIVFKKQPIQTNAIYEGFLDGESVVYVAVKIYDPGSGKWHKTYVALQDGLSVAITYDGQQLMTTT